MVSLYQPQFRGRRLGQRGWFLDPFPLVMSRDSVLFPLTLPGLQLMYWAQPGGVFQDSAMTTPAVNINDPIGALFDWSGNGNHAVQSVSGSRPSLQISSGLPVVQFNGTSSWLATAGNVTVGDAYTFFLIYKITLDGTSDVLFGNANGGSTGALIFISSNHLRTSTLAQDLVVSSVAETAAINYILFPRNGSGTDKVVRNGVDATGTVTAVTLTTSNKPMILGKNPNGSNSFYTGSILMAGFYNRQLSTTEQSGLNTFLASAA